MTYSQLHSLSQLQHQDQMYKIVLFQTNLARLKTGTYIYEVERILDKQVIRKGRGSSTQYLIRWKGCLERGGIESRISETVKN